MTVECHGAACAGCEQDGASAGNKQGATTAWQPGQPSSILMWCHGFWYPGLCCLQDFLPHS